MDDSLDFELANVGPGPDPLRLSAFAREHDAVLVLFQRDHYCTNCRQQVQDVAARYGEFEQRDAAVVSVVPEPRERVAEWQDRYDLPFPLLSDPGAEVGEQYDQPVRFGPLGKVSDFFGRMPEAVLLDARDGLRVAWVHRGRSTFDRPDVAEFLARVDDLLAEGGAGDEPDGGAGDEPARGGAGDEPDGDEPAGGGAGTDAGA